MKATDFAKWCDDEYAALATWNPVGDAGHMIAGQRAAFAEMAAILRSGVLPRHTKKNPRAAERESGT